MSELSHVDPGGRYRTLEPKNLEFISRPIHLPLRGADGTRGLGMAAAMPIQSVCTPRRGGISGVLQPDDSVRHLYRLPHHDITTLLLYESPGGDINRHFRLHLL